MPEVASLIILKLWWQIVDHLLTFHGILVQILHNQELQKPIFLETLTITRRKPRAALGLEA